MSKEVVDFREATGEEALWTNSMFSGMPAYQISTQYKANLIQYIDKALMLGLPRPANMLFLYLLGFYILLLSLKVDYRLAVVGAIAFCIFLLLFHYYSGRAYDQSTRYCLCANGSGCCALYLQRERCF